VTGELGRLHGLALLQVGHELADGGVQVADPGDGADLRHLRGDLRVVDRSERILVVHLRDQQLQERIGQVLRARAGRARAGSGRIRAADDVRRRKQAGQVVGRSDSHCECSL
jgi:hypothetical protein